MKKLINTVALLSIVSIFAASASAIMQNPPRQMLPDPGAEDDMSWMDGASSSSSTGTVTTCSGRERTCWGSGDCYGCQTVSCDGNSSSWSMWETCNGQTVSESGSCTQLSGDTYYCESMASDTSSTL